MDRLRNALRERVLLVVNVACISPPLQALFYESIRSISIDAAMSKLFRLSNSEESAVGCRLRKRKHFFQANSNLLQRRLHSVKTSSSAATTVHQPRAICPGATFNSELSRFYLIDPSTGIRCSLSRYHCPGLSLRQSDQPRQINIVPAIVSRFRIAAGQNRTDGLPHATCSRIENR